MTYPIGIPTKIRAGDNLEFCYRAYDVAGNELTVDGGYTLYFVLANATTNYSVSSTTETDQGYFVQATFATTSGWTAGDYTSSIYASDGTNRYTQTQAFTVIEPSLNSAVDGRSTYRQIRDAIDAAILGQATSNQLAMSVAGRSIQRMSLEDLMKAKSTFDSLVASEERKQDLKDGRSPSNTIHTRLRGNF